MARKIISFSYCCGVRDKDNYRIALFPSATEILVTARSFIRWPTTDIVGNCSRLENDKYEADDYSALYDRNYNYGGYIYRRNVDNLQ